MKTTIAEKTIHDYSREYLLGAIEILDHLRKENNSDMLKECSKEELYEVFLIIRGRS